MKTVAKPNIGLTFLVELDLEFDSFKGRSPKEFASLVEDDLCDVLGELRPDVQGTYVVLKEITEYPNED